jgi:hypothetical protein
VKRLSGEKIPKKMKPLSADEIKAELEKREEERKRYFCITYAYRKIHRGGHGERKIPPWDFEVDLVSVHPFVWYGLVIEKSKELSMAYNHQFKLITWIEITKEEYELGKQVGLA